MTSKEPESERVGTPVTKEHLRKNLMGDEVHHNALEIDDDGDSGITLEQILALKERFDAADLDGGGSLDMKEFMDAFGSIINKDGSMTQDQIARLFMQIDANSDGGIDWNEFSTYMLMESQSSGTVMTKKVSSFYIPDSIGSKMELDCYHKEPADVMLIDHAGSQYLTASKDGTIRVWSTATMQLNKTIPCSNSWILCLCFLSKTSRLCVSTADRRIRIYDMHMSEHGMEVELQHPALCLFSWTWNDLEMLAIGNDKGDVTVVDVSKGLKATPKLTAKVPMQKKRPDYWSDSQTRQVHEGWVEQIDIIEDLGGLVTCGTDSAITIFEYPFNSDPKNPNRIVPRRTLKHARGHQKGVKCFQWVRSHKLIVSGGLDRMVVVWNPYTCKPVISLDGHQAGITKLQVNVEFEQVISLSMDKVVKVWDLRNNECIQTMAAAESAKGDRASTIIYDNQRHRLVTCGLRPHVFKINPAILSTSTDVTHRSPLVAGLYNKNFGHVVTVAEDSETSVWRFSNGSRIFNYIDNERDDETFLATAAFDDMGRRLLTGDHCGKVKVWNFSNGACIKTLVKPHDSHRRQEVTGLCMYQYEDTRFFAASSWDRKISVWVDDSEDSGLVEPFLQIGGNDDDILTIAFTYPKALATGASDGTVHVFDVESGARRLSMVCSKVKTGETPRNQNSSAATALANTQYVEKILFLEQRNKTIVSVGADNHLRFWEGAWMDPVPQTCTNSFSLSRLAVIINAGHWPEFGLVDQQTDPDNTMLVTADEGGFVKVWDISTYDWKNPKSSQVVAKYFWRAHASSISTVDLIETHEAAHTTGPLVLTASADKRVLLWTMDGRLIGQFGQLWDLEDMSTWVSTTSADILNDISAGIHSVMAQAKRGDDDSDEEETDDILRILDDRLRKKGPNAIQFKVSQMKEVPSEIPGKNKSKKGRDYEIDQLTGEKIYKNAPPKKSTNAPPKKSTVGSHMYQYLTDNRVLIYKVHKNAPSKKSAVEQERQRPPMTPYLKHFVKKLDPDNLA